MLSGSKAEIKAAYEADPLGERRELVQAVIDRIIAHQEYYIEPLLKLNQEYPLPEKIKYLTTTPQNKLNYVSESALHNL